MARKAALATSVPDEQGLYGFRLIVRGKKKDGSRPRRMKTLAARDEHHAHELAESLIEEIVEANGFNLDSIYFNIYPPVGFLCKGGISKGYGIGKDGLVRWVGRSHKAGDPIPAAVKTAVKAVVKAAKAAKSARKAPARAAARTRTTAKAAA